jgi:hypothetical protein
MSHVLTPPEKDRKKAKSADGHAAPWEWNRRVGWVSACVGVATGMTMGLWSFDGPLAPPDWLGEYGDTARRLARLGHIAFFGLGILDILLAHELGRSALGPRGKGLASWAMILGNIFLPLTLFASAWYRPIKYAMGAPVLAVFVALVLAAYGACAGAGTEGGRNDDNSA